MYKHVQYILLLIIYTIKYVITIDYFGVMDAFFRLGVILMEISYIIPSFKEISEIEQQKWTFHFHQGDIWKKP